MNMNELNEGLKRAKHKLEESIFCYELYGDEEYKEWIKQDKAKVRATKAMMKAELARK